MNNTSKEATHHNTSKERIVRHGHGINFYDSGKIEFEGDWRGNVPFGQGTYFAEDMNPILMGSWKKGKPNKCHVYKNDDDCDGILKGIYAGFIENNKRNGFGILFSFDKVKLYEGMWKDSKRHGQGTMYNVKGRPIFTGEWKDDKPCIDLSIPDDTTISHPGGKQHITFNVWNYKLTLKGTHYTGKVVKYHPSGCKSYEGDLDYAKRHGTGTSFNEKGIRAYTGEWKDDKRHGHGTSFKPDGSVDFKGRWENDEPVR